MLDVTGWPATTDAVTPSVKVVHNGVERQVSGVNVRRELPSSFAEQVVGLGGLTAADGSIDWADSADVEAAATPSAFTFPRSWPPKSGDKIEISVGYNDAMAKVLTGKVKDVAGSPFEQPSSSVVDFTGRLDRLVSVPPLQAIMPPINDGGAYRYIGLYPTYFTDVAARVGRYFTTPPMGTNCVLSVPCMGSLWPERGTITQAQRYGDPDAAPNWRATPWTIGVSNVQASITPSGNSVLDRPMEITAMFDVTAGAVSVSVAWGGASLQLRSDTGSVQARLLNNSGITTIATLPLVSGAYTARFTPSGSTLNVALRSAAGSESTGAVAKPSESVNNADAVIVSSNDVGALVSGIQVSFPPTAWTTVNYTRKAFFTLAAHSAHLTASPAIVNRNALDLLTEQSKAELAAMWIDQEDRLHWVNRYALIARTPSGTLTAQDNLLDLPWREDNSAVTSAVALNYRKPTVQRSRNPRFEVWQSSYSQVEADGTEAFDELIHPDADTDWVQVDTGVNAPEDNAALNRMVGTAVGLYYFMENGTPGEAGYTSIEGFNKDWATATVHRWDYRTYQVTTTVQAVSTAGWEAHEFSLKIPTEKQSAAGGGWGYNLGGLQLPVVRASAVTNWANQLTTQNGTDADAPELEHDAGWWVQSDAAAQDLCDWLATETSVPMVTIRNIPIVPDSRIELGDVHWIEDTTGLRIKSLITGINQQISGTPAAWGMDLDALVLSVETP